MKERLQRAYFTEGRVVSDPETLAELAAEAGLEAEAVRRMLASEAYAAAVQADIQEAWRLGIHGVPFFVLAGKYGVSGAQPSELFAQALAQAWAETSG
jgi:predicted DsbA family dithiol-disulfide isomerase